MINKFLTLTVTLTVPLSIPPFVGYIIFIQSKLSFIFLLTVSQQVAYNLNHSGYSLLNVKTLPNSSLGFKALFNVNKSISKSLFACYIQHMQKTTYLNVKAPLVENTLHYSIQSVSVFVVGYLIETKVQEKVSFASSAYMKELNFLR